MAPIWSAMRSWRKCRSGWIWRENFGDAAFKRRYRIEGAPDLAALRRLGLDLPVAAEGSVGVDATITEAPGGREVELALDLAPAAIDAPRIGWRKPAGEPGHPRCVHGDPGRRADPGHQDSGW